MADRSKMASEQRTEHDWPADVKRNFGKDMLGCDRFRLL